MGSSCCKSKNQSSEKGDFKKIQDEMIPSTLIMPSNPSRTIVFSSHPLSPALNKFAFDMYMQLEASHPNQNVFFSPLSIALALALVETGASNNTREEIQALIDPSKSAECGKLYGALQEEILKVEDGQFRIANTLLHDAGIALNGTYLKNVQTWLKTEIKQAPFRNQLEEARHMINRWVSDKTAGKIPEFIQRGQLSEDTAFVLVNAVYMKMDWLVQFDEGQTKKRAFYKFGGTEEQKVWFMCRENPLSQARSDLRVIELPYKGDSMSMFIILPDRRDGIKDIENQMNTEFLMDLFRTCTRMSGRLVVEIPKFSMRFKTSLLSTFSNLGCRNLKQLGRMCSDPRARISDAIHEAYVKIDEKGTEAAAATGMVGLWASGGPAESIYFFIADHPFLFFIVHKPTSAIIFMGKINYVDDKE